MFLTTSPKCRAPSREAADTKKDCDVGSSSWIVSRLTGHKTTLDRGLFKTVPVKMDLDVILRLPSFLLATTLQVQDIINLTLPKSYEYCLEDL